MKGLEAIPVKRASAANPELPGWRRPPRGMCVAILGPDGAGKSTLINSLKVQHLGFNGTAVYHLGPRLIGRRSGEDPHTDPHGKAPYPPWLSILKILYYTALYALDYLFRVRPSLRRSTLVLFDRYYDDLLVDPVRYRYGGPIVFARLASRIIHRPDLWFILDAPEEQLLKRKQEIAREELLRQRDAYRSLAVRLPNSVMLDGSSSPDDIARSASDMIRDYRSWRDADRARPRGRTGEGETLDWLSAILCPVSSQVPEDLGVQRPDFHPFAWAPLPDGRGYLFPIEPRKAAVNALDLYNAQNLKGRIAKGILTIGLRTGAARYCMPRVQLARRRDADGGDGVHPPLQEYLRRALGQRDLRIAISAGTPGPHRKPVLLVLTGQGSPLAYVKVGANDATNTLVQHEADVLRRLASYPFHSFNAPTMYHAGWWGDRFVCVQSPLGERMRLVPPTLTSQHMAVAGELAASHTQWMPLSESHFWKALATRAEGISNAHLRHTALQGINRAEKSLNGARLPFHFSHGDFAPYNMKLGGGKLFVFDWEYARLDGLPGRDIFHFCFQAMRHLEKRDPDAIYAAFLHDGSLRTSIDTYFYGLGLKNIPQDFLFLLYRLDQLVSEASVTRCSGALLAEMRAFANFLRTTEGLARAIA